MKKLLKNAIITPDGTELESRFQHDLISHTDKNGNYYAIDGGLSYQRILCDGQHDYTDASLWSIDEHSKLINGLTWGSYGKNGNEDLQYIKIKDMSTNHIKAVLETQPNNRYKKVFEEELKFRFI